MIPIRRWVPPDPLARYPHDLRAGSFRSSDHTTPRSDLPAKITSQLWTEASSVWVSDATRDGYRTDDHRTLCSGSYRGGWLLFRGEPSNWHHPVHRIARWDHPSRMDRPTIRAGSSAVRMYTNPMHRMSTVHGVGATYTIHAFNVGRSTYPLSGWFLRRTDSEGPATQPVVLRKDHGASLGRPCA